MNNLLVSLLILVILVGVGSTLIRDLNTSTSKENIPKINPVNIATYKISNGTGETLIIVLNYGYKDVYVSKIICYSMNDTNYVEKQVDKILNPGKALALSIDSGGSANTFCIVLGDSWEKILV